MDHTQPNRSGVALPPTQHVQRYPHIMVKIDLFWGTPEFLEYVNQLTVVEKDRGVRGGFAPEVVNELLDLRDCMVRHITEFNLSDQDKCRALSLANQPGAWVAQARPAIQSEQLFKTKTAPEKKKQGPKKKKGLFGFLWR
jgi:hypothetical protein